MQINLHLLQKKTISGCYKFILQQNYDKEKEALLQALRSRDGLFASERSRQAELARLRREERKARHEDKFDTAALVLGLAQAQKANLEEMLVL